MAHRHRTRTNAWLCSTTANLPMTLSSSLVLQNGRLLASVLRASMASFARVHGERFALVEVVAPERSAVLFNVMLVADHEFSCCGTWQA